MKSIRKIFVVFGFLASLFLGRLAWADPLNLRILQNKDGSVDVFIGDIHSLNNNYEKARKELCFVVKMFGKRACCIVEDIIEKGRHEKTDQYVEKKTREGNLRKEFLQGLHEYLKNNGIESYNAECRFGMWFTVRDALASVEAALAEAEAYNDAGWSDYYARARERVACNIAHLNTTDQDLGYHSACYRAIDIDAVYSDRNVKKRGYIARGHIAADLVDMRGIHFGCVANKDITFHIYGAGHCDAIIYSKKQKGATEIFTFGISDVLGYDMARKRKNYRAQTISIAEAFKAFLTAYDQSKLSNEHAVDEKRTADQRTKQKNKRPADHLDERPSAKRLKA